MGHQAGWLALGAGIAGGADVILIPEIPYDIEIVAGPSAADPAGHELQHRRHRGRCPRPGRGATYDDLIARRVAARGEKDKRAADAEIAAFDADHTGHAIRFAQQLEPLTGLESRVTILGYVQRGGTPSPVDRLLAARLGNAAADLVAAGTFGVMVGRHGDGTGQCRSSSWRASARPCRSTTRGSTPLVTSGRASAIEAFAVEARAHPQRPLNRRRPS